MLSIELECNIVMPTKLDYGHHIHSVRLSPGDIRNEFQSEFDAYKMVFCCIGNACVCLVRNTVYATFTPIKRRFQKLHFQLESKAIFQMEISLNWHYVKILNRWDIEEHRKTNRGKYTGRVWWCVTVYQWLSLYMPRGRDVQSQTRQTCRINSTTNPKLINHGFSHEQISFPLRISII